MTTDADELDWILEQSKCAVLFYDYNQVVGPSGIDYERFEEKMRNPYKKTYNIVFYSCNADEGAGRK